LECTRSVFAAIVATGLSSTTTVSGVAPTLSKIT